MELQTIKIQTKSDNTSHQKDYTGGSKVATGGQKQTV
jgi:hypothetical protein